jgi:hypothetical protein
MQTNISFTGIYLAVQGFILKEVEKSKIIEFVNGAFMLTRLSNENIMVHTLCRQ